MCLHACICASCTHVWVCVVSEFQDIESSLFPLRYCYCLTNKTNDLTGEKPPSLYTDCLCTVSVCLSNHFSVFSDFTAILLDVMGNSTSYLQELFKSSSILSGKALTIITHPHTHTCMQLRVALMYYNVVVLVLYYISVNTSLCVLLSFFQSVRRTALTASISVSWLDSQVSLSSLCIRIYFISKVY